MQLEIKIKSFAYERDRIVLENIQFEVGNKQIVGVLGGSGCGKSTLLRIICGLISNQTHEYFIGEVKFNNLIEIKTLRSQGKIGFMFQEPSLLPNLTVKENIEFPLKIISRKCIRDEFIEELINVVGLNRYKNYLPTKLSGGMQTRVALARTFVTRPELLLLDEPFSSLDYGWRLDLYEKLNHLIKKFCSTVIIVSHDISEILLLANKIILISQRGQIIKETVLKVEKPASFEPDVLNAYLDNIKEELIQLQWGIVKSRRD